MPVHQFRESTAVAIRDPPHQFVIAVQLPAFLAGS
jgi:hypothetical protein